MPKAKKQAQVSVTYRGDLDAIEYQGYHLPRDEAVEVDEGVAKFLANNDYFDVEGVTPDEPASTVAPEDALAAERSAHQAEIDKLNAEHKAAMEAQADSLKAGWQEQHDALVAENEQLKAALAGDQAAAAAVQADQQPAQG
jgi:hypothetical protein